MATTKKFRVSSKSPVWIGGFVFLPGEEVSITVNSAKYLILSDVLEDDVDYTPPTLTPFIESDKIVLRRGEHDRVLLRTELVSFFAPLIGLVDSTAPVIATMAGQSLAENQSLSLNLSANETVTWTKTGGADAALFTLTGSTLTMAAKDFEAPVDANHDNIYIVSLTATDASGNQSVLNLAVTVTDVAELSPPSVLTSPSITGLAQVGQTLTRVDATWTNSPTSFSHQWYANGIAINGATGPTYIPVSADIGKTITVSTVATNAAGPSGLVTSTGTSAVVDMAETPFLGTTDYRFASARPRPAIVVGPVAAGSEYQIHRMEWYSPPYIAREFMAGLPSHYTRTDGVLPSETVAPNAINFEGLKCSALINGSWITTTVSVMDASVSYNGATSFTLDPSTNEVGVLVGWSFGVDVPPGTKMLFHIALNVAAGGSMIGGLAPTAASGRLDACVGSATTLVGSVSTTGALPAGTDARANGSGLYTVSYIVAKPKNGLTTRVFWVLHDSKGWGRNMMERYLDTPLLSCGFIAMAFDESSIGPRIPCGLTGVPSIGAAEWKLRTGWNRKLDLIRKLPNRPYTDVLTDHYNNGNILDANYRTSLSTYYDLLLSESRSWGNSNAKLHQTRPIPSPSSTDFCTTLAGQPAGSSNLTSTRFAGFDADLLANYWPQITSIVNMNRDYAYDQSTNRDKVKLTGKSYTLAAAYTAGSTSIQFNEQPVVGEYVVLDPTTNTGAGYVRGVTGSGPYTVTLFPGVNKALAQGTVVPTTFVGDRIGLHPANQGHALLSTVLAEWKAARAVA